MGPVVEQEGLKLFDLFVERLHRVEVSVNNVVENAVQQRTYAVAITPSL